MSHHTDCDRNVSYSQFQGINPLDFCNKQGCSQNKLAEYLGVTRKTAWKICQPQNLTNPRYHAYHLALAFIDQQLERGKAA